MLFSVSSHFSHSFLYTATTTLAVFRPKKRADKRDEEETCYSCFLSLSFPFYFGETFLHSKDSSTRLLSASHVPPLSLKEQSTGTPPVQGRQFPAWPV
mmetsp:Transcript_8531/g.16689  ORF Transcript_8531/g.16689 Transcript_8531/m.16689 type:complete len:98 (+) Transcript_8531:1471-1764(+)